MQEQLSRRIKIHIKDFHLKFFMEVRQADAPKIMHSVAYGMILLNKAKRMLVNYLILLYYYIIFCNIYPKQFYICTIVDEGEHGLEE